MMNNFQVYYGEYTLSHWIKLILRKDIELPPYQRNFVWSEDKTIKLIESLQKGLFVPTVIIGTYFENGEEKHYIIDGQQRLSAILLTYLNKFPNKGFELKDTSKMADDNDDNDIDEDKITDIENWQLTEIQKLNENYKDKDKIRGKLCSPYYKELELRNGLDNDFFDKNFLGFSYIKPNTNQQTEDEQKKYYSSIFRNINISGQKLTPEESRSSLYWLDSRLEKLFKPNGFDNIMIDNNKIDFARYLSFVSEYYCNHKKSNGNIDEFKIAKGYGTKIKPYEEYIEKFVYHCVGEDRQSSFLKLDDMFKDIEATKACLLDIPALIDNIRGGQKFSSIIDADYYLFGLIFWKVFMNKEFKSAETSKIAALNTNFNNEIIKAKKDSLYVKRPSSIGRLRERLYSSIKEYKLLFMD